MPDQNDSAADDVNLEGGAVNLEGDEFELEGDEFGLEGNAVKLENDEATGDLDDSSEHAENNDNTDDTSRDGADPVDLDEEDGEKVDTTMGEWSLCATMVFLAGYLVIVMFWYLEHPVWETLVSFDTEVYRAEFPVGVATILLLISVLSAFCSLISLVADKNNRRTMLIRILTLGPLLPTAASAFMIWVIIQRGAGNSILENFLG